MSTELWQRAKQEFARAVALEGASREEFLDQLQAESGELAAEVRELLAANASADGGSFLKHPASLEQTVELTTPVQADATIAFTATTAEPRSDVGAAGSSQHETGSVADEVLSVEATIAHSRQSSTVPEVVNPNAPTIDFNSLDATLGAPPTGSTEQEPQEYATVDSVGGSSGQASVSSALLADDYELQEQLGKGGMGVVYKAYQRSLRKYVAVKLIPDRHLRSPQEIARFQIEAESAARLDHPGIVPVYQVGESNGVHYYTMALVEGKSLSSFVGDVSRRLPQRRVAELMEQVSRAVQYAHDRAVIHRDIKPANVMLDKDGKPRLTDFGLAKVLKEDEGLTVTGQVMGTPSFMAPEQATGKGELSNRTDVYSLGATLYAMLAGKPPFAAGSVLMTLKAVVQEEAPSLSKFVPGVSLDLQTICEKCLAKRPEDRYASAGDMADDLRRYLDGFPLAARPVGPTTRLIRWCRRNPALSSLIATTMMAIVVGSMTSVAFGIQARRELARANANAKELGNTIDEAYVAGADDAAAEDPGTQRVQGRLLSIAQKYYSNMLARGDIAPATMAATALKLGVAQAALGDSEAAAESFDLAIVTLEQELKTHPKDAALAVMLGTVHNEYVRMDERIYNSQGKDAADSEQAELLDRWLLHAKEGERWRSLAAEWNPKDLETRRLAANSKMQLGIVSMEYGHLRGDDEALNRADTSFNEAREMFNALVAEAPDFWQARRDIALVSLAHATLRLDQTTPDPDTEELEFDEADADLIEQAITFCDEAIANLVGIPSKPMNLKIQWQLAKAYESRATTRLFVDDHKSALNDLNQEVEILQPMTAKYPLVASYRMDLAEAYFNMARAHYALNDEQGFDSVDQFQYTLIAGITLDKDDVRLQNRLVERTGELASQFASGGAFEKGIEFFEHAIALIDGMQDSLHEPNQGLQATKSRLERKMRDMKENRLPQVNPVA